jgi:hypothetical protein
MMRTVGAVLITLLALVLVLGTGASAALAAAKGALDDALQTFGPLLLLPIGYLVFGLVSALRHNRNSRTRSSR